MRTGRSTRPFVVFNNFADAEFWNDYQRASDDQRDRATTLLLGFDDSRSTIVVSLGQYLIYSSINLLINLHRDFMQM